MASLLLLPAPASAFVLGASCIRKSTASAQRGAMLSVPGHRLKASAGSSHFLRNLRLRRAGLVRAGEGEQAGEVTTIPAGAQGGAAGLPLYKHILLPVMDRNPFLNEATKQAVAFATSLAKQNSAEITVVVIDEDQKEDSENHKQRLDSIRFHLGEGGFEEFALLERLGEGKMPAAVVGEVADDLNLDLVVLPMEAVHHKHIDCNLLAEFVPCPVMLLPL